MEDGFEPFADYFKCSFACFDFRHVLGRHLAGCIQTQSRNGRTSGVLSVIAHDPRNSINNKPCSDRCYSLPQAFLLRHECRSPLSHLKLYPRQSYGQQTCILVYDMG